MLLFEVQLETSEDDEEQNEDEESENGMPPCLELSIGAAVRRSFELTCRMNMPPISSLISAAAQGLRQRHQSELEEGSRMPYIDKFEVQMVGVEAREFMCMIANDVACRICFGVSPFVLDMAIFGACGIGRGFEFRFSCV